MGAELVRKATSVDEQRGRNLRVRFILRLPFDATWFGLRHTRSLDIVAQPRRRRPRQGHAVVQRRVMERVLIVRAHSAWRPAGAAAGDGASRGRARRSLHFSARPALAACSACPWEAVLASGSGLHLGWARARCGLRGGALSGRLARRGESIGRRVGRGGAAEGLGDTAQ